MEWNVSFDVAAVILLLMLFIWYLIEKRIPLKSHRMFLIVIMYVFASSSMEIYTADIGEGVKSGLELNFLWAYSIRSMFIHLASAMFFAYTVVLADLKKKTAIRLMRFSGICSVIFVAINILNPVFKWAYYIGENHEFHVEPFGYLLFALDAVMVFGGAFIMYKNVKNISFVKTIVLSLNIAFTGVCIYMEVRYCVLLINFAVAIACVTLYQYLNNPESMMDAQTKLFNRNFLGVYVKNEFTKNKGFGVITIAMDDFKFINKTYGVAIGDQMLTQVGTYLSSIGKNTMAFRFGSDQFCIVLNDNSEKQDIIAKKIEDRFKHPWYSDSTAGIMMSASICCIACPKDANDFGTLIEVMDYSMSVAKKSKKGTVSHTDELELDKLREEKAIEKAVRLAIDRDELMVYYQPIFSVEHNNYNSAEALVRLKDPVLGWISPEIFIPIAEKNGLIVQMGETILEKVCKFIKNKEIKNTTVDYIEVNISPVQLVQNNFVERVKMILEKYDVSPSQINMEITETATLTGAAIVNENINALVEYGIKFSLDDYGSGYANIDYINNMPFSIIKIDKFIIWDSFKNEKAGITLEYTIGMLNALKLFIVAEGVETEDMKKKLESVGCHYMQGWYYSKAVDEDDFMHLLSA